MALSVNNHALTQRVSRPLPEQVRALRQTVHFTLAEFGEIVYVSPRTVVSWEAGTRVCPPATWELLLLYFDRAAPRRFVDDHAARLALLDAPAKRPNFES